MVRLTLALCLSLLSLSAHADTGTLGIQLGATQIDNGGTSWRPTFQADFAFELIGPLQAGAFVQVMASGLPLRHPRLGGGVLVALRPDIPVLRLRPLLEASAGRVQVAIDANSKNTAWITSITLGLGIDLGNSVFLEGRVARSWLHQLPENSALSDRMWRVSLGIGVDFP